MPRKKQNVKSDNVKIAVGDLMTELGVSYNSLFGTYSTEMRPDNLTVHDYLVMQNTDATVRAITRILTMPIIASQIRIMPDKNDTGERDFVDTVLMGTKRSGGMSTPMPFVISDMTRAVFEGFRAYEKVWQIIPYGQYKGLLGYRKLAPRDSQTVTIRLDSSGGFKGIHQIATFQGNPINLDIPTEKVVLFTFQKDRHPFYGESLLKPCWQSYMNKQKLLYIANKKMEIDALGYKILKISRNSGISQSQVTDAETAADTMGFNTRITLPDGIDLEINRASTGVDPTPLIAYYDNQIATAALAQAATVGGKATYNYSYGQAYGIQESFLNMMVTSIIRQMESTINEWIIPELIDFNFGTKSYPKIKLMQIDDERTNFILKLFNDVAKKDPSKLSNTFLNEISNRVADSLGIEVRDDVMDAFQDGINSTGKNVTIPEDVKANLKSLNCEDLNQIRKMGEDFAMLS